MADQYNRTALEYAASWFGLDCVKLLLQEGCPLPEGGVPRLVEYLRTNPDLNKVSVSAQIPVETPCVQQVP
jgi:hypothetical protein